MTPAPQRRFTLWPFGWELIHRAQGFMNYESLLTIAGIALSRLHEMTVTEEIRDLRGRESGETTLPVGGLLGAPPRDELFSVAGYVPRKEYLEPPISFAYHVSTPFRRFEGTHHIIHGIRVSGNLPGSLLPYELPRAFPLEITELRFSLAFMRSSRITSTLGFAPVTYSTFSFEYQDGSSALEIVEQGLAAREPSRMLELPWIRQIWDHCAVAAGDPHSSGR